MAEDPNFSFDKTLSLEEHPTEGCNAEKAFHVGVKKGAAVLFYDLKEEQHMKGVIDPLSEHAGCDTSVSFLFCLGEEEEKEKNKNKREPLKEELKGEKRKGKRKIFFFFFEGVFIFPFSLFLSREKNQK